MKNRYITFVNLGYGHRQPIEFDAEPDKVLEKAYDLYLKSAVNEDLVLDNDPEDLGAPQVYKIQLMDKDNKLFVKMCQSFKDSILQDIDNKDNVRVTALSKLSEAEKRALGL